MQLLNKTISLCVLIFFATLCKAQYVFAPYGIIKDKDGFTNVRDSRGKKVKIIDTLFNNQVFEDMDLALSRINQDITSDWHEILYGNYASLKKPGNKTFLRKKGYVHSSRILYLSDLPQLEKTIVNDSVFEFTNDSIKVVVETSDFISRNHILTKKEGVLVKIDSDTAWGVNGNTPAFLFDVHTITIYSHGQQYTFPKVNTSNLLSPNPDNMHIAVSDNNTLFIVMSNGDAAGAYNVVWTVKNLKVVGQFIHEDF